MLIIFFDESINSEFLALGQMTNQQVYKILLCILRLREEMRIVAGQIVTSSPLQCTSSQWAEH